jgi:hypothetical protein
VEIVIAGAIFVMVFGAATVAVARDQETHRVLAAHFGPELGALHAVDRIAAELRMAGEWGEDRDHDGELDPGEDCNGNGTLDADWDLPDASVDQEHISFNRRVDLRNAAEALDLVGVYTRRVTYRLEGTSVVREWEHEGVDGSVEVRRAVIARGARRLRFSRLGLLVTVSLEVRIQEAAYAPGARTFTVRVWLRN